MDGNECEENVFHVGGLAPSLDPCQRATTNARAIHEQSAFVLLFETSWRQLCIDDWRRIIFCDTGQCPLSA